MPTTRKPGNVMVTATGVKLVDFGISAAIGEADVSEGQILGTPAYPARASTTTLNGPSRPDRVIGFSSAHVAALEFVAA